MAATPAVILTTFVHDNTEHHKKADSNDNGERQEVGVYVKWFIIRNQEVHFRIHRVGKSLQKQLCNGQTITGINSGWYVGQPSNGFVMKNIEIKPSCWGIKINPVLASDCPMNTDEISVLSSPPMGTSLSELIL